MTGRHALEVGWISAASSIALVCFVGAYLMGSIIFMSASLLTIYLFLCIYVRDPSSPLVIVGLFWVLYIVSYPLGVSLFQPQGVDDNLRSTVFFGGVALISFCIGFVVFTGLSRRGTEYISFRDLRRVGSFEGVALYASLIISCLLIPFYFYDLMVVSASSARYKYELESSSSGAPLYILLFSLFVFFGLLYERSSSRLSRWYLYFFVFIFIVYYLFTGQRDFLVRSVMLVLFLIYLREKLSIKTIWLVFVCGIVMQPVLQAGKGLLSFGAGSFEFTAASLFSGEFSSQGRNFYYILQDLGRAQFVYDGSMLRDIKRFLNLGEQSSTNLFGSEFLGRRGGAGMGFSLLAQFYIAGGVLALIVFGLFSAFAMQFIRRWFPLSVLGVYVYVTFVFAFGYSLRADLANLLSQSIKFGAIPVFAFLFIVMLFSVMFRNFRRI